MMSGQGLYVVHPYPKASSVLPEPQRLTVSLNEEKAPMRAQYKYLLRSRHRPSRLENWLAGHP